MGNTQVQSDTNEDIATEIAHLGAVLSSQEHREAPKPTTTDLESAAERSAVEFSMEAEANPLLADLSTPEVSTLFPITTV